MRPRLPTRGLKWYFEHNDGRLIHKWDHYFDIYERHFARFRGAAPVVLEIGVSHGGSLQMWRHYLGRRAVIVGIDIDPRTASLTGPGIDVRIGDQSDSTFLATLVEQYGPFDIVIDDGSHLPAHQIASLEFLWPHVRNGGVYLVEDLATSYWPEYGGGLRVPTSFIEYVKPIIDDLNAFNSREVGFEPTEWTRTVTGLHVYDGVVVFDRGSRTPPTTRLTGRPSFDTLFGRPADEAIDAAHRRQLAELGRPVARLRRLWRDPIGTTRRVAERVRRSFGR
jgi:hypothetical protein